MTSSSWTWAAASCRGSSHERCDSRLQDAFKCLVANVPGQPIAIVVSDGAGTAPFGGQGASLICRTIGMRVRHHFSTVDILPDRGILDGWVDATRNQIASVAERRGLVPKDFAATLILAVSTASETVVLHVGDGCVVVRDGARGYWIAPTWPDHGEYASTTSFVTAESGSCARVSRYEGCISALAVFSDGLERLVLDLRSRKPFGSFFDSIIAPVESSKRQGKDSGLSRHLLDYLKSERVSNRTDDDRTLVLAVRRWPATP